MRLIGRTKLAPLAASDSETGKWISNWIKELEYAQWKHPSEVSSQFPRSYRNSDSRFVFPLLHRPTGVEVLIAFPQGTALVTAITDLEIHNGH
ncbi:MULTISPECIES: hypothetical protein [Asaia]|uniref:hypothetical protein n=1 Tax=Asaia TaxID=91914 RepID=UPI002FC2FD58